MPDLVAAAIVCLHLARAVAVATALIFHPLAIVGAVIWISTGDMPESSPICFVWASIGCYVTILISTLAIEHMVRR